MKPPANPAYRARPARQRGFTLVEAVVVMVVIGILAGTMVLFIRRPVQNYADTVARADMSDVADLALRRMARELRGALPNSIRQSATGSVSLLEFIPTTAGAIYLSGDDNADSTHHALSFTSSSTLDFDVVGPLPQGKYAIAQNSMLVIYNLGAGYPSADAYGQKNLATVSAINGARITLSSNPFAANATIPSPTRRFNVVTAPVTFRCDSTSGKLERYWNYGFSANQADPVGSGKSALLASGVAGCQFSVTQTANLHTALIGMAIALSRPVVGVAMTETVTLANQIHVDNTP